MSTRRCSTVMVVVTGADGGVADRGVAGGLLRLGVTEQLLHDVLGDALLDHARPEGGAELVRGDLDGWPVRSFIVLLTRSAR